MCKRNKREFSYLKEAEITTAVTESFQKLVLHDEVYENVVRSVKDLYNEGKKLGGYCSLVDRTSLDEVKEQMQRLLDGYVEGVVEADAYKERLSKLQEKQSLLEDGLKKSAADRNPFAVLMKLINIAKNGVELFRDGDRSSIRELMLLILIELVWDGKSVGITVRYPFDVMMSWGIARNGGADLSSSQQVSSPQYQEQIQPHQPSVARLNLSVFPGGTAGEFPMYKGIDLGSWEWEEIVRIYDLFELHWLGPGYVMELPIADKVVEFASAVGGARVYHCAA